MKYFRLITTFTFISCLVIAQDQTRLNYADFEKLDKDNRPLSAREGKVIFGVTAQNTSNQPKIAPKMFGAQGPLTQRLGFEFELTKPNDYASAYMRIIGMKDRGRLDDWAKTLRLMFP